MAMMNLTDADYELLSAYIDEMLAEEERAALEIRLKAEADLRRELNALRQTVQLVNQLPALKAPRNFTLTPEMLGITPDSKTASHPQKSPAPRRVIPFPFLSALSAVASIALIVIGFGLVLSSTSKDGRMQSSEPQQQVGIYSNTLPGDGVSLTSVAAAPSSTPPPSLVLILPTSTLQPQTTQGLADQIATTDFFAEEAENAQASPESSVSGAAPAMAVPPSQEEDTQRAVTTDADQETLNYAEENATGLYVIPATQSAPGFSPQIGGGGSGGGGVAPGEGYESAEGIIIQADGTIKPFIPPFEGTMMPMGASNAADMANAPITEFAIVPPVPMPTNTDTRDVFTIAPSPEILATQAPTQIAGIAAGADENDDAQAEAPIDSTTGSLIQEPVVGRTQEKESTDEESIPLGVALLAGGAVLMAISIGFFWMSRRQA